MFELFNDLSKERTNLVVSHIETWFHCKVNLKFLGGLNALFCIDWGYIIGVHSCQSIERVKVAQL